MLGDARKRHIQIAVIYDGISLKVTVRINALEVQRPIAEFSM